MVMHSVKKAMGTNTLDKVGPEVEEGANVPSDVSNVDVISTNPTVLRFLDMMEKIAALPSFEFLEASGFDAGVVQRANYNVSNFNLYLKELKASMGVNDDLRRLFHDQNNVLIPIMSSLDLLNVGRVGNILPSARKIELVRKYLNPSRELLMRNCRTSMALTTDNYSMREVALEKALFSGTDRVARVFGYEVIRGDKDTPLTSGKVVLDVSPNLTANIDPDVLSIAMDNLIGNPMRIAKDGGNGKIGVRVSVRLTAFDCIQITVTDKGGGLHYFGLYEKYVEQAKAKRDSGEELTSFDWMMLRRSYTVKDLVAHLFEDGVSMSGSTGKGLSTVKKIVFGHGGDIEMGNNDDGVGACIKILIPDTQSNDLVLRARLLANARIAMGLNL